MSEPVITSIAAFHEQLGQLEPKDAVYLYRGQANATWPVDCSAARRLAADPANPIETQLIRHLLVGYLDILISTTRMRGFLPPDFNESISDLELLAHLQHQGAATGLIDFTRQPLVALWFACHESLDTDGAIYVLDRSQTVEISKREDLENKTLQSIFGKDSQTNNVPAGREDFENKTLQSTYAKDPLWSWEPSVLGNRIVAQSSVFVLGVPAIAQDKWKKIIVRKGSKSDILTQLETMYGINEEELFADFPGYAVANASTKNFDVKRSIRYWQEQIELASEDKATAHFNCGVAYHAIKDFENAIEQYNKTIRLNPNSAVAYNHRGNAKNSRGEHKDAITDYNEAIRLKPDLAIAYINRGVAKRGLDYYEKAINDYNEAIILKPDFALAYYNRGLAYRALNRRDKARRDFKKARDLAQQVGNESLAASADQVLRRFNASDEDE